MSHHKAFFTATLFATNEYLTRYSTLKFPLISYGENRVTLTSYIELILQFLLIDLTLQLLRDSTPPKQDYIPSILEPQKTWGHVMLHQNVKLSDCCKCQGT